MWASVFITKPRPSADTECHWVPFSSSHSAHRLSHHTSPSPFSQLGEFSAADFPEHQIPDSSQPLGTSSSWGISPASSLGFFHLNSHLLYVFLLPVKCHPLTQDAKSLFRSCEQEDLVLLLEQVFHTWNKAATESLVVSSEKTKQKKSVLEKCRDLAFHKTEIMLGVELVESPFNAQKDDGFCEQYINQGYVPQSHATSEQGNVVVIF